MIIYKATNVIDGKFYIGLTKGPISGPIGRHKNKSKKVVSIFYNAIRKHGFENFTWEIIDSDAISYEHLQELEIWYIAELKPDYNSTKGGEGTLGFSPSIESINKGRLKRIGVPLSKEHRANLRTAKLGKKGPPSKRKGRKFGPISEEHKLAISKASKNKKLSEKCKFNLSKAHKGKKLSEDHKSSISKTLIGNIPWNKGIKQIDYKKKGA